MDFLVHVRSCHLDILNIGGRTAWGPKHDHSACTRTGPHIEFIDRDHARCHAYWIGVFASGGGITSAGREVNELMHFKGQWLISVRDVDPQDQFLSGRRRLLEEANFPRLSGVRYDIPNS